METQVARESEHSLVVIVGRRGIPRNLKNVLEPSRQTTDRVYCTILVCILCTNSYRYITQV